MKGLNPEFYHHKINLAKDAIPVQQRRYRLNPNYAAKVKEEIDKLLWVGFIKPIKRATWLSPIVVVPKKNGKLRVCVDYGKLNTATITDACVEDALAVANIEDLLPGAICAFLDLEPGGKLGVQTLDEAQLTEYFSEFSVTAKAFKTLGGPDECFREFVGFFGLYALLNLNAYSIPKSRGSLLVAKWEDRRIDWAVMVSEALIREVSTTHKKYPAGLAY
jgi:hypothetical protein